MKPNSLLVNYFQETGKAQNKSEPSKFALTGYVLNQVPFKLPLKLSLIWWNHTSFLRFNFVIVDSV